MIEADLVTVLSALADDRVFPDIAPQGTAKPYITYQQVGGGAVNFMEGAAVPTKSARIQINVWSGTRMEAMTLIRQIEDAVIVSPLYGFVHGAAIARYDEETKLRGATQDFTFWFAT